MMLFETLYIALLAFSGTVYVILLAIFLYGWFKLKKSTLKQSFYKPVSVSIVIAARNESGTVTQCLEALSMQNYPMHLIEIIVVDDNSEDDTFEKVKGFCMLRPHMHIKALRLSDYGLMTKKKAVAKGVSIATGELLLLTDADCLIGPEWISSMLASYQQTDAALVCGPVLYAPRRGFFQAFQALDFMSLMAGSAGAAGAGMPFMNNAANMAVGKSVYDKIAEDPMGEQYASGDDVFLLHRIKKQYQGKVSFNLKNEAAITTEPVTDIKTLLEQRMRWASKSRGYSDAMALTVTVTVFLFNFLLICTLAGAIFSKSFFIAATLMYALKFIADFPLLFGMMRFSGRSELIFHYVWVQLLYPFYVTLTGLLVLSGRKYVWKGRKTV